MRKFIALILIAVMAMSSAAVTTLAAFDDVSPGERFAASVERLVQYGILSGKGDGRFEPLASLTRAEMAKISTVVGGLESLAAANRGISVYSDMDGSYWASGYVNVAAKNRLILGYPNGTYEPEKALTFAETTTIVLRLLGYSPEDLGDNWPEAYTAKAAELKLTEGLHYGDYDTISRGDMALIIDRALLTDIDKNDTPTPTKLIQLMDYTITDELIILGTGAVNKNLMSDEVSTTAGTYKKLTDSADDYITRKVKLVLDKDGKVANVLPIEQNGKDIVIQNVVGVELAYSESGSGANSSIKMDNTSVVYHQNAKKTFQDVKADMEVGMTMAIYYSANGSYDYGVIKDFEIQGPVTVTRSMTGGEDHIGSMPINNSNLRVIRDGYEVKLSDLKAFDVVYYNSVSNIIYAYNDKVTGVYEKAIPSKASVSSIQLSGKTYSLETQAAVKALADSPGAYAINDYITILLGKDGEVADVISANTNTSSEYGIILSSSERISDDPDDNGNRYHYVTVFAATGIEQEFKTDKSYNNYRGRVIKYAFNDNGFMIPDFINTRTTRGVIDREKETIGSYWISSDTKLIDLNYVPDRNNAEPAIAKVISLSDITQSSITEANVVHAEVDTTFGEISFIVFNDITMGKYQYGVVSKAVVTSDRDGRITNASYTLNLKNAEQSFSGSVKYSADEGQPVMVNIQNNTIREMRALIELAKSGSLVSIDVKNVRIGTTSYKMAPDVSVYLYKNFEYYLVSMNDISSYNMKNVRLFADKSASDGGLVRVVVFTQ